MIKFTKRDFIASIMILLSSISCVQMRAEEPHSFVLIIDDRENNSDSETTEERSSPYEDVHCPEGMVHVPASTFMMGCSPGDDDCRDNEKPAKKVTISKGFCMDETEVTQGAYQNLMGENPSDNSSCGNKCPVESLWWSNAKKYCQKAGKRLPTEAEWEYAARGGTTTRYYWGNSNDESTVKQYAWYIFNASDGYWTDPHSAKDGIQRVKQKKPNAFGLYDMIGNVAEWVEDCYSDGWYNIMPNINPLNASTDCQDRVVRGNAWDGEPWSIHVSYRNEDNTGSVFIGFRCAKDIQDLSTNLHINANVEGFKVFIDGYEKGGSVGKSIEITIHEPRKVTVRVEKEGYETWEKSGVEVRSGETTELNVQLKENRNAKSCPKGMAYIPPGEFMMGCSSGDDDCLGKEKPAHLVRITKGFCMKTTEVTQGEYKSVMGDNPSEYADCGEECPVEMVSWDDARDYCKKTGGRLPTEAEWEYAARAGATTKYYWGNSMDGDYAWNGNSDNTTHPVGQKKPNAFGLYDMSGNVLEWVNDWYVDYSAAPTTNPKGPATGDSRVRRGGRWGGYFVYDVRVSSRDDGYYIGGDAGDRYYNGGNVKIGFRCVQDF